MATCKRCGEELSYARQKMKSKYCIDCFEFLEYQKESIQIAHELRYDSSIESKLKRAQTNEEIARIMHDYREGKI